MATYATLTVPVLDIIGADFNASRASVWIEPNVPLVLADSIRVGGRREQVVNGVATFANLVTTNSADNPASFGYRVTITAPPKGAAGRKDIVNLTTADFPFTATANLKDIPEAWDNIVLPVEWRSAFRDEMEALRDQVQDISGISTPDGVVAALVADGGSDTAGALSATFATPAPQRVVAFGDSITDDGYVISGVDVAYPHVGWWPWANAFLGWRFDLLADAGISGNSLLQMIDRIDTDVLAHGPDWVWMNGGVNSINDGLPAATITSQFETIFTRFREAGVRILCLTVNPSGYFDAAENAVRLQVNRWLRDYGAANKGVIIVDTAPYIQNPAGLGPATGMTRDTLHPSARGAQAMGYAVAQALAPITVPAGPLTAGADTTNLIAGKGMFPGNDGSGLATDWPGPYAAGAAPTYAKVARTDGVLGEWQQVTVPSGANVVGIHTSAITTGWAVGDTVYAAVEFEVSGIDTAAPDNQVNTELVLNCLDGSSNIIAATHFGYDSSGPTGGSQTFPLSLSGVMRTPNLTIPAGTTSLMPVLWSRGGGVRRWARCDVRVLD